MTFLTRTPDGKVVLYSRATGQRFERWPVDARDMLASGDYTQEAPDSQADGTAPAEVVAADPVPHVTEATEQNSAVSPTGAPLVVSDAAAVTTAVPMQAPHRSRRGARA